MYKNCYFNRQDGLIHLWDDERGYLTFPYEKYAYQIDPKGEYTTMTGLKVKKVKNWSKEAEKQNLVFEHDVQPAMRTLIDRYYESDDVSKDLTVLFFDIEVAKEGRYSEAKDADNTITSISYYDNKSKEYWCLLLDIEGKLQPTGNLKVFRSETQLLHHFVSQWNRIKPDIVTGWNIEPFDIPYLYNRLVKMMGFDFAKKLSPIKIVEQRDFGKKDIVCRIAGISVLDYLSLYKKFTYSQEPSYTLDAIAKKEIGRGKIQYEGSLDDFYKNDIEGFVKYNLVDVELVVEMDKKLDFIEIARGICHKGHVTYENFIFPSTYLDGAALTYCKRNNMVAVNSEKGNDNSTAEGAFVKVPTPGLYRFISAIDASSLYPSNIRTLNISPETLFGKVLNWNESDWIQKKDIELEIDIFVNNISDSLFGKNQNRIRVPLLQFQEFLNDNQLSIASNGCLYKIDKVGLIPAILSTWFDERKQYRKLANECKLSGDQIGFELNDKKQLVTKILLNSFYGVLLLPTFRFYQRDNGEAVTVTGQSVLQYAIKVANVYYNKKLGTENVDYVIMGDTDSMALPMLPLVNLTYDGDDETILTEKSLEVALEVQNVVNNSFEVYAKKVHNVKTHYWDFKQELIARRAFYGQAKKRYAMWIINKGGIQTDQLEVKGLDVVRSSFPKTFRQFQKNIIKDILHDKPASELNEMIREFKQVYRKDPLKDIMLPTGVKEMSKYKNGAKGTPIHVKSAQNYNKLLDLHKIINIPKLDDGDKILWAYVKQNPYGFETMALRGYDDPEEIITFIERFIDKEKIFENTLISKLQTIWEDLGWGKIILEKNNEFF